MCCILQDDDQLHNLRRRFKRLRITGIVALTCFEKPVVNTIYDIAEGGISFLQANESDINTHEFEMDILVFDSLTDFEYLITNVMGQVMWKGLVFAPELHQPIWRFNVEFIDLDGPQQDSLQRLCSVEKQQLFGFSTSIYKRYQAVHEKMKPMARSEGEFPDNQ